MRMERLYVGIVRVMGLSFFEDVDAFMEVAYDCHDPFWEGQVYVDWNVEASCWSRGIGEFE